MRKQIYPVKISKGQGFSMSSFRFLFTAMGLPARPNHGPELILIFVTSYPEFMFSHFQPAKIEFPIKAWKDT